jgi:exodeoxyribonuclease VII small subunit
LDIKLKNSKFNPIIKAIILILTLAFAFLAGTNGLELARKTIYFNNAERIQDTPAYKENIENELGSILYRRSVVHALMNNYGQNMTFEELLKELNSVVELLESGKLSLEESVEVYQKGMVLSIECKKRLDAAKEVIVKKVTSEGETNLK